jgi:WD40 repeat protein
MKEIREHGVRVVKRILFAVLLISAMLGSFAAFADEKPEIFVQLGHAAPVRAVAYTPEGTVAVSGSEDKTLKIWDVQTGKLIRTLSGHRHFVTCLDVSPDGRLIASGSYDDTVRLWDLHTGEELAVFSGHEGAISGIAFSPDGRFLASCAVNDTTTRLWDVRTLKESRSFDNAYSFRNVAFSPDGKYLVMVGSWQRVLDLATGEIVRVFKEPSSESVAFSPNGHLIACGGSGLTLYNFITGDELHRFTESSVLDTAFSPDGHTIATASYDDAATLWDVRTGKERGKLVGHTDDVNALSFSPDGSSLITGSEDFTIKQWQLDDPGAEPLTLTGHSAAVNAVEYSPSGEHIYSGSGDSTIKSWDLYEAGLDGILAGHQGGVATLSVSSDGTRVVSLGEDNRLILWDAEKGQMVKTVKEELYAARSVDLSSDDRYALVGRGLKGPRLYDVESGIEVREYTGKAHFYITSTSGGAAQREDAPFTISAAALSPDGRFIAGGTDDGTLRIWEVLSRQEIYSAVVHRDAVLSVVWSPDGKYLFSGSADATVMMWELVRDMGFVKPVRTFASDGHTIAALAVSPNGRYLASASHDRTLKLWDIDTGRELRTFRGHKSTVRSVDFSPDGRYIVSGSWDTTSKIWEVNTGKEIAMMVGFDDDEWVIVTPSGYYNSSPRGAEHLNVRLGDRVYSIDNYVETFYRPDIVKSVLAGVKMKNISSLEDVASPPNVSLEGLEKVSDDTVRINLKISDTGGGIGDVRVLLNDSVVILDRVRGVRNEEGDFTVSYDVKVTDGKNSISAVVYNGDNSMRSNGVRKDFLTRVKGTPKVSLHALVIGINEYSNPKLELAYAVADANLIAQALKKAAEPLFDQVDIKVLTSREETRRESILNAITSYGNLNPQDLFVFYVASHGIVDQGEYFLISSDVGSVSSRKLRETAISENAIKSAIANIPTFKKLIIIDTCNSQSLGDSLQAALLTRGLTEDTAFKVLSRAVGVTILSATKTTQEALEGYKDHGLFTYVIAEGLRGGADYDGDGFIKTFELADYVDNEVPRVAERVFRRAQYPTVSPAGQGFPIGRVTK